jgi:pyruvate dehydrogenase E1 component
MSDPARPTDVDPDETREWLASLESVLRVHGPERAHQLLEVLIDAARRGGAHLPFKQTTAYLNTIATRDEPPYPGDREVEKRLEALMRWNAMAMVVRANRKGTELGGHIATYASSAQLYEVGFNHFWHAPTAAHGGDLVYIQGHSSPGIYARAFLEGRLTEQQLEGFREEVDRKGISSYPHPWLMPDFWQFPTVSMGLGPIMAIYQARFMRYLENRGLIAAPLYGKGRKVWCFIGDGETDEPETLGAIALAAREGLDNLTFVINCNLQRLDGPVRGNAKIIQELEGVFRGAGWNVLKVIWGSNWDPLLAQDGEGHLRRVMQETVDGEYQNYKAKDGAYVRAKFFGKHPKLLEMVAHMSDQDIWNLKRGGHDARKIHAAYQAATEHRGQPTVILAKTVKGYGMGKAGEGLMTTHQQKKLDDPAVREFRDRFNIPVADERLHELPFVKPAAGSAEAKYIAARREALGGPLPQRRTDAPKLAVPGLEAFKQQLEASGERELSTTMAFVRILNALLKDRALGKHVVPIIPDEARTFGMEGMFRQLGIYSAVGQKYEPQDADQLAFYKEDIKGQILEEGINEAGAMSSWVAAATAYANHGIQMVPFYIYYSMFGFQRIGDLAWAAGDMRARGFLIGGTAGRTTLNGEGLQHEDGHSHLMSATIPNCVSYDPTYAYELAVIVQDGLKRMVEGQENVFYYLTCMNENYLHPAMPEGAADGIRRGMYLLRSHAPKAKQRVQLMGSGTILREVEAAARLLEEDFGVGSDVWSCTSFTELRRDGLAARRWNLLHPTAKPKRSFVEQQLEGRKGPVVAATDYIRAFPDQVREFVPGRFVTLGTDGFGRSDSRDNLRRFFEVDRRYVVVAALKALAEDGALDAKVAADAIAKYGLDADAPAPWTV